MVLSRLGERALPLYQLMKKMSPFEWNDKADEAFQDLKRMLSTSPVLDALFRVKLNLVFAEVGECFLQVVEEREVLLGLYHDVVHVNVDIAAELRQQAFLHAALEGGVGFFEEKRRTIGEEVAKLLAAGFIMEVFHPEWLANPVLVLKKNKTWRMCIDYTSLNKACPKDPFGKSS